MRLVWVLLPFSLVFVWGRSVDTRVSQDDVDPLKRVSCIPEPTATRDLCQKRGCIWSPAPTSSDQQIPACYYPKDTGYYVTKENDRIWKKSPNSVKNPYCPDAETLHVKIYDNHIFIGENDSFIPDIDINRDATFDSEDPLEVQIKNGTVASIIVKRKDGTKIWDTSIGGLIFGKKYIQISTYLPTDKIYGFGEQIHQTLKHDLSVYKTWPMFARDQVPNSGIESRQNLYGVHNFYLGLEQSGKAHGVFMLNSHAQEIVTGPGPHLTYRAIGGRFEFYFLPGPTPEDVAQQYQRIVGNPYLPAYWALGYQFCRYGYKNLDDLKDTVRRIQSSQIPLDVVFADIDYMDRYKDFTIGQEKWGDFANYTDQLHKKNVKLTLIFDPAVEVDYKAFETGIDMEASFISWPRKDLVPHKTQDLYPLAKDTNIMLSVVWPDKHVAFPDFYDDTKKTEKWWIHEFEKFHKKLAFDGIWIDMNEMSVFGTNDPNPGYFGNPDHPNITQLSCPVTGSDSELDNPPYKTWASYLINRDLCDATLCMFSLANRGKQQLFSVKSMYGLKETISTNQALKTSTGKRGQVISRSTFPSSGRYGGHWLGDNSAHWDDLRTAIIGAQEFNLFGITHVGADVCGFINATNEELCLRWQQLGAFQSFFRNHNDIASPPQDPSQWQSVARTTRAANLFRYRHLPYLYTLHFQSSLNGGTVVRPVFFEFPTDNQTHELSYQFMWGSSILVMPVTKPDVLTVDGYLPKSAEWYYLYSRGYGTQATTTTTTFDAPKNSSAPNFLRGGSIVPRQVPGLTTTDTRKNNFQLVIACNQKLEPINSATGELFWDDGETWADSDNHLSGLDYYHFTYKFTYSASEAELHISLKKESRGVIPVPPLEQIEIFGYTRTPDLRSVRVDGKDPKISLQESSYSPATKILRLSRQSGGIVKNYGAVITWNNLH